MADEDERHMKRFDRHRPEVGTTGHERPKPLARAARQVQRDE
jgi:hypothetical protein